MLTTTIFSFSKNVDASNWKIVDDVVMGGKSNGTFTINNDGFGEFKGKISLQNNGGFSSVRYTTKSLKLNKYSKITIKLKGDSKAYQFRIKANSSDKHSYIKPFTTSGNWEDITINLSSMHPAFRGNTLNSPNFNKETISELAFLIGNKKEETFKLLIKSIELH